MPITIDQTEAQCWVRFEGEIDIAVAADLKRILLQALTSGKAVRVDLEQVADIDITALQLLWAAAREANATSQEFGLAGQLPEPIAAAAMEAGFEHFPIPAAEVPQD